MVIYKLPYLLILTCVCQLQLSAQQIKVPSKADSLKGSITVGRAWWDLKHYAIDIYPDFVNKSLTGRNRIAFKVMKENRNAMMQIDLQSPLVIDSAIFGGEKAPIERTGDAWFLKLPNLKMKAEFVVDIYYSGTPKESFNPPWDSGISWNTDSRGRPWITMGVQGLGASVWLPCKEHQSDEPDHGMSISITTPDSLTAVANGRLHRVTTKVKGTSTYEWAVQSPINNYGIAFYIGKYMEVKDVYKGEKGNLDTDYWVLDYNQHKVQSYLKLEVNKTLEAFEHWFGPYPFYKDSFKIVETPYPGMEHQSAIAYGNGFKYGRVKANNLSYWDLKTDRLIVHEIAHEWFGNSITTNDITEQWIHEGFAGYAEELFIEYQYGKKAANEFFEARTVGKTKNVEPLIRRYGIFETGGSYVYLRGWKLIHMLRTIVDDDEKFRKIMRKINDRFFHKSISSAQVESLFTKLSGRDLKPVFDQYLRTSNVPVLEYEVVGNTFRFRYINCIHDFTMPIKTNLTGQKWLYPTTSWKEFKLSAVKNSTLNITSDFYVEAKNSNQ